MTTFLLGLHSGIRWIVVALAVINVVWLVLVLLGRGANERLDRILMLVFTIFLDIQVLVGLLRAVELVGAQGFYTQILLHALVMIIALGVAHRVSRLKTGDRKTRARNTLIAIVVVLMLVFIGVMLLPNGANRWSFRS